MTVGESIKQIRLAKNLTQKQLGELCKPQMADSAIRRYENRRANPKIETAKKIADALKVPFEYLMYGNQEKAGENIRYYRDRQGLSVEELSEKTNIPLERLKAYENDLEVPTTKEIISISKSLYLTPGEFTAIQGMKFVDTPDGMKRVNPPHDELRRDTLLHHYEELNDKGKDKAIERIRELSHVLEYQKE